MFLKFKEDELFFTIKCVLFRVHFDAESLVGGGCTEGDCFFLLYFNGWLFLRSLGGSGMRIYNVVSIDDATSVYYRV